MEMIQEDEAEEVGIQIGEIGAGAGADFKAGAEEEIIIAISLGS